ncbi:MAG: BTAD domain-containing putative transcriptional regulator [Gaiellaceae bacterium]
MSVTIRLLGGFGVDVDGVEVDDKAWRLRKARTLVKVLALEPGRRLHREQVMELLWPDLDASAAQNNFHQAVHAARRVLGSGRLTLDDGMLTLVGDTGTDVEVFEAAAAAARDGGDYGAALRLFGGELLPEDRYEPWADAHRATLTDLHSALCLELAERQEPGDAVATLQRALQVDSLHEPAHRALMSSYERLGRRQDALAQYQRLRAALRRALEADPAPETRALYRELLVLEPDDMAVLAPRGLPGELTSFIGREGELAAIAGELGETRLLTLTGPGGSGKTRLAVAAAARARDAGRDGVVFVDLGPIADPELVGDAAATAFGLLVPAKRAAADALAEQISALRTLLVLDTCEHLAAACAALAELLLERCPEVTILATSRERLRAAGERTWPVPGLTSAESVQLFVSRARDADPSFEPTGDTIREIEELCARLEGMPLALEMAAARVPAFSPGQIAARLDQSLDILADGRRTALSRQQTLRATISWSHDLLDGEEQVFFRRLAVFSGSFSLDAAEQVCVGGAVERRDVVTLLLRVVEKSLAVVEDTVLARYRLLDTVRQFAEEQLAAAGEREVVEARLREWALALTADPPPLALLELDHDNVRTALDSGLRGDPQSSVRLAANVWRFWLDRNYFTEGARRLRAVLDVAPEATELRVQTLLAAAALEQRCGRPGEFMGLAGDAVALARQMRPSFAADALHEYALLATAGSSLDDCRDACGEALELAGDHPVRASILNVMALVPYYLGALGEARARLESALEHLHTMGGGAPPFFEGVSLGLAILPIGPGGRLRALHEETIFQFHRLDRDHAVPQLLFNLAMLARADGRRDDTVAILDEALARTRRLADPQGEALALAALGNCARSFGEPDRGLRWLEQAVELRRAYGDRRAVGMTETAAALARATAGDLAGAETVFARTHDRFRAADDAPAEGGALLMWGLAVEGAGEAGRAADLLTAGAEVWERGLLGAFPGWGLLAAGDGLLNAGRKAEARSAVERAARIFKASGVTPGVALCAEHPAAKPVQRSSKETAS